MEVEDNDFLEFKRSTGNWTEDQKLLWGYLSTIVNLLGHISEHLEGEKPEDQIEKVKESLETGMPPIRGSSREKPSRVPQIRLE